MLSWSPDSLHFCIVFQFNLGNQKTAETMLCLGIGEPAIGGSFHFYEIYIRTYE